MHRLKLIFFLSMTTLTFLVNGLLWFIIWKKFPPSDIPYVIHYSILNGADVFGTKTNLFVIPLLGVAIFAINIYIAFALRKKEPFLSYLFSVMALCTNLFLLIALFGLLKFNGQL